jgi:hypothetical protein
LDGAASAGIRGIRALAIGMLNRDPCGCQLAADALLTQIASVV